MRVKAMLCALCSMVHNAEGCNNFNKLYDPDSQMEEKIWNQYPR